MGFMVIGEKFYEELGYLFYAAASADKKVAKEEVAELKKCVREVWLPLEDSTDTFGSDAAFHIESVFDWLLENGEKGQDALSNFEEYFLNHKKLFSESIKSKILDTVSRISGAYGTENKAEKEFWNQVKILLN
ncbi:MAG: hypothetical protein U0V72_07375 [Cytophagales bacterium]